jgi:hypothetical protein
MFHIKGPKMIMMWTLKKKGVFSLRQKFGEASLKSKKFANQSSHNPKLD